MTERERKILLARALQEKARRAQLTGADAMRARGLASPDPAEANAAALEGMKPQTNLVEQVGAGTNEGIAGMVGLPVDAVTGGLNMGARALGLPEIQKPVGGSESLRDILEPFITEAEPQTAAQRIGRRVGQDAGAGAVVAPVAGIASLGGMALNTGADLVSGLAGGVTSEVTSNPTLNLIASMLGGGSVIAGSRAMRPGPVVPTMDELRGTQRQAYANVEANPAQLTPQATTDLQQRLTGRMAAENIDPYLHPKASRTLERIGELDQPSIYQVEQRRRLVGRDVAGAPDPSERQLGSIMKDEIDDYLGGLQPRQVQGGSVDDAIADLRTGREMTQRIKKSEAIDQAVYKAENRAATSGTGGNEINTTRQNIRAILDDPKKRRGFSEDEIAAMQEIVDGTPTINAARLLGRMSPNAGALPLFTSGGLVGAAGATSNPLLAAPPAIGLIAKTIGERMTKRQISDLSRLILNGGPVPAKTLSDAEKAVIAALVAAQASSQQQLPQ